MKQTFASLLAIAAVATVSNAEELPALPADYDYAPVSAYFTQCLESQVLTNYSVVPFTGGDYCIPADKVADCVTAMWSRWADVNKSFDEHKLNGGKQFRELRAGAQWSFDIPKDLEPFFQAAHPGETPLEYAKLKYMFGYKGELTGSLPLFINIHGSGAVANEWAMAQQVCLGDLSTQLFYFIAQIPNGWADGEYSWYRWYYRSKQWVWEKVFRQSFLNDNIDNNGLFFIGISEGAYGSQRLGAFYADYLAGIGPMAGGEPLPNCPPENMRHCAFCLRTGQYDTAFSRNLFTEYVGEYLDELAAKYPGDYAHKVVIEPGQPHTLNQYNIATTPWLLDYRRNATPKHFNWENFPMDGRYRDGFYNLRVFKRSNTDEESRGYYEVDIDDDNNIEVKVSTVYIQVLEYDNSQAYLPLYIKKNYAPATTGQFKIYLNDKLVDMSRPVTLTVNGRKLYEGMVTPTLDDIVNSIAVYYDPERIFTASIDVDLDNMTAVAPQPAGIDNVTVDSDRDMPVEYYNLQGIKVENPGNGLYLKRQGNRSTKVYIKD